MQEKVLNQKSKKLLALLGQKGVIDGFYLAGGTGLALCLGHRKSIDFDWFSKDNFDSQHLRRKLAQLGKIIVRGEEKGTLDLTLLGINLTFLHYPYRILFPLSNYGGIKIADYRDIACMKLDALSARGSKKDFIDLYFVLKKIPFEKLLQLFERKYKGIEINKLHILKSLSYFADARKEPMPLMIKKIEWQEIEKYFTNLARETLRKA